MSGTSGDDEITNFLFKQSQFEHIFQVEKGWVVKVKSKIHTWMKILYRVLYSKKVHSIRKINSRMSSRMSSRQL
jgi:hypothetical protein